MQKLSPLSSSSSSSSSASSETEFVFYESFHIPHLPENFLFCLCPFVSCNCEEGDHHNLYGLHSSVENFFFCFAIVVVVVG
jgi:hypothetical protein